MTAFNDTFEIDLNEMDLIEDALRAEIKALASQPDATLETGRKMRAVKDLLGRLHNQKVFYRPKRGYVGG